MRRRQPYGDKRRDSDLPDFQPPAGTCKDGSVSRESSALQLRSEGRIAGGDNAYGQFLDVKSPLPGDDPWLLDIRASGTGDGVFALAGLPAIEVRVLDHRPDREVRAAGGVVALN